MANLVLNNEMFPAWRGSSQCQREKEKESVMLTCNFNAIARISLSIGAAANYQVRTNTRISRRDGN